MSTDRIALTISDGLAELRLDRPDAGNAIDPAWVTAFAAAVAELEARAGADARAVLVTATGRAFTVGGDLAHFAGALDDLEAAMAAMVAPFHDALVRLAELPVPVVCAVQGPIAGGGLGLAWCADVVLAAPQARFATGFHLLGLSGDGASSWWLPRLVGLRLAQEMLLLGRVLDAEEALGAGLVTEVVAAEALDDRAREVAAALAAGPTVALGHARALLRAAAQTPMREYYAREVDAMLACSRTADAVEGVRAFGERRPPRFGGV